MSYRRYYYPFYYVALNRCGRLSYELPIPHPTPTPDDILDKLRFGRTLFFRPSPYQIQTKIYLSVTLLRKCREINLVARILKKKTKNPRDTLHTPAKHFVPFSRREPTTENPLFFPRNLISFSFRIYMYTYTYTFP